MATITITTPSVDPDQSFTVTADQYTALAWFAAKVAASEGAQASTVEQFIVNYLQHWQNARVTEYRDAFNAQLRGRFEAASPETQAAVLAMLESNLPGGGQ